MEPPRPRLITIPTTDRGFRHQVEVMWTRRASLSPGDLERHLRRMFPRVIVRERLLSAEDPTWYVYRDGRWTPPETTAWWTEPGLPRIELSLEGWIEDANLPARGLLGLPADRFEPRHFTDFVVPGTLDDSNSLFKVIAAGHSITATTLIRAQGGEIIGCDLRAYRSGDRLIGVFRLAEDVKVEAPPTAPPTTMVCHPTSDAAFAGYTDLLMARMPEPTPEGLAVRLHRLFPHARVEPAGDRWHVFRDATGVQGPADGWWLDPALPRARYDSQAFIVEANDAARQMLGKELVGLHWQELATPGATEKVPDMLRIIMSRGVVISRFRMPGADGAFLEFDSFTEFDGSTFTTIMRPIPIEAIPGPVPEPIPETDAKTVAD